MIEFDITLLQKTKQRVSVKGTPTRKAHYRTQEVGRKEEEPVKKKSPREGTGKIASLPESLRDKILELRGEGRSGAAIKEHLESMITFETPASGDLKSELESIRDHSIMLSQEAAKKGNTPERKAYLRRKEKENREKESGLRAGLKGDPKIHIDGKATDIDLVGKGVISEDGEIKINAQSLVDWAKSRGVGAKRERKTVKDIESAAKEASEKASKESTENLARLQVENKRLKEEIETLRRSKMSTDALKSKLNTENYILREKLKVC